MLVNGTLPNPLKLVFSRDGKNREAKGKRKQREALCVLVDLPRTRGVGCCVAEAWRRRDGAKRQDPPRQEAADPKMNQGNKPSEDDGERYVVSFLCRRVLTVVC